MTAVEPETAEYDHDDDRDAAEAEEELVKEDVEEGEEFIHSPATLYAAEKRGASVEETLKVFGNELMVGLIFG